MSTTPTDRKYTKTHEWYKVDGHTVTVGITQFAADELTDITFVDLPAAGTRVEAGSACGEIESVKTTSELYSAVTGEVIDTNGALADEPERVNNDPFESGWMLKIKADDLGPLDGLMDAAAYDEMNG